MQACTERTGTVIRAQGLGVMWALDLEAYDSYQLPDFESAHVSVTYMPNRDDQNLLKNTLLYWSLSFWLTSLCIMGSSFNHLIRTDSN